MIYLVKPNRDEAPDRLDEIRDMRETFQMDSRIASRISLLLTSRVAENTPESRSPTLEVPDHRFAIICSPG